jgi:hypothetical protein
MAAGFEWYGMESVIASALADDKIEHVAERSAPSLGGRSGHFDFVLTGSIPLVIEVKYARFQNFRLTVELAHAAVSLFRRCHFVVIVVGRTDESWQDIAPYVSDVVFFEPTPDQFRTVDDHARHVVHGVLERRDALRVLSMDDGQQTAAWRQAARTAELPGTYDAHMARLFGGEGVAEAMRVVAASFRSIVGTADLPVGAVEKELLELAAEFASSHYTACALRVGRCLELSVYAFARRLGVNPCGGQFRAVAAVHDRVAALEASVQELAAADPPGSGAHDKRLARLRTDVDKLHGAVTDLLLTLNTLQEQEKVLRGPDNLQAILRRVLRSPALQAAPDARSRLGLIIEGKKDSEILDIRNDAAHGDPDLREREVAKDDSVRCLFTLATYVQGLANVVDAACVA